MGLVEKVIWNLTRTEITKQNCRETRDVTFGDMKLILYGTEEQPQVVELEPRPNDISDRNLDYPAADSLIDENETFRERREPIINQNTNWMDLIGQNVAVRNADHLWIHHCLTSMEPLLKSNIVSLFKYFHAKQYSL